MLKRVLFGIFLIIVAFSLPWWCSVGLSIVGLFFFENLYEVIVVGIIIDSLYGKNWEIFGWYFIFTLILFVAFILIGKLRKNLLI